MHSIAGEEIKSNKMNSHRSILQIRGAPNGENNRVENELLGSLSKEGADYPERLVSFDESIYGSSPRNYLKVEQRFGFSLPISVDAYFYRCVI